MKLIIACIAFICVIIPANSSPGNMPASYPKSMQETILEASKANSVPYKVLLGICIVESKLNPNLIHKDDGGSGSYGLCQIKLGTAKSLGFKGNYRLLLNPNINAYYSAKLFRYQLDRYGNIRAAIRAYNRGFDDGQTTKYHRQVYLAMRRE